MGRGRKALSAVKSLKCNYQLKDEVKTEKLPIWMKKLYKYTKLYCLPTCFFSLRGAFLKSHTSRKIEHFQMPQITPGSQRINQNIELFLGKRDVVCPTGSRAVPSLPRKRDHFVVAGRRGALVNPSQLRGTDSPNAVHSVIVWSGNLLQLRVIGNCNGSSVSLNFKRTKAVSVSNSAVSSW